MIEKVISKNEYVTTFCLICGQEITARRDEENPRCKSCEGLKK